MWQFLNKEEKINYERDTESRYQIRDWTEYLYLIQYMFSTYLKVVKEEENFRKQKFLRLG